MPKSLLKFRKLLHYLVFECFMPPLIGLAIMLTFSIAAGELWLRATKPFNNNVYPVTFVDGVGPQLKPHELVQRTNQHDFWVKEKTNSLGFPDREPPSSPPTKACRIVFLGDSFVEAVQMPINNKFHVLLEELAKNNDLGYPLETVAIGYSGTGQANQLAFYDKYTPILHPDVVALVAVDNDLSNNSPYLEAVRSGWNPERLPYSFTVRGKNGWEETKPDPEWLAHAFISAAPVSPKAYAKLYETSYLNNWLYSLLRVRKPELAARLSGKTSYEKQLAEHLAWAKSLPGGSGRYEGWNYPEDLDLDKMFLAQVLPPVFQDAMTMSKEAIRRFAARSRHDDIKLLALGTHSLIRHEGLSKTHKERKLSDDLYRDRMKKLFEDEGIPFIDQGAYIKQQGIPISDAYFKSDSHWNALGHRTAAEAVFQYLKDHPEVCDKRKERL